MLQYAIVFIDSATASFLYRLAKILSVHFRLELFRKYSAILFV